MHEDGWLHSLLCLSCAVHLVCLICNDTWFSTLPSLCDCACKSLMLNSNVSKVREQFSIFSLYGWLKLWPLLQRSYQNRDCSPDPYPTVLYMCFLSLFHCGFQWQTHRETQLVLLNVEADHVQLMWETYDQEFRIRNPNLSGQHFCIFQCLINCQICLPNKYTDTAGTECGIMWENFTLIQLGRGRQ